MARTSFFRRLARPLKTLRDLAAEGADRAADRARRGWDNMRYRYRNGSEKFRNWRDMNASHLRDRYWQGRAGKAMRRKMGREWDGARRHARAMRESRGLIDARGRLTEKGRTRPELRGHLRVRDLREAHRHGKDHDRASKRTARQPEARPVTPTVRVSPNGRSPQPASNGRTPPPSSNGHRPVDRDPGNARVRTPEHGRTTGRAR